MKNSEQPAFPISEEETDRIDDEIKIYTGLTKREYFAGLAIQGFLANSKFTSDGHDTIARWAIEQADELLKQLEK